VKVRFLVPLAIFGVLLVFFGVGLKLNPREVPSPLINKPAPEFNLPQLFVPQQTIGRKSLLGQVYLLNVWASWCVSCRQEHPLLVQLSRTGAVPIYGLNYKDDRGDAQDWLRKFGNPYTMSGFDQDGRVGFDFGVYGVPETFLIDRQGVIRYKQIGPITRQALHDKILPMVKELQG